MRISLFITCLTDTFYPRVGQAMVLLLEHLGHEVDFPMEQTCCGQPMFNNGYNDEASDLAKGMINVFEDSDIVISPSGSCCAMIHENYPHLLGSDPAWAQRSRQFVKKTYEFVDFLVNKEQINLMELGCRWEGKTTYHFSCHLRGLGMTNECTQLMDQIQGLEYTPLEKMEQCCGFGGTFAVKYPEISGAMVRDKVSCIKDTAAEYLISNDGGCSMNISGSCNREGVPIKVKHIAEILAEGLGLMPREDTVVTAQ